MTVPKPQIPEVKGVADIKASKILESIKIVVEQATARTPTKKPIELLKDGANLNGLLNKINETVAQLQGDPPPPPRTASATTTSVIISTGGGGGSPVAISHSLVNDLTETLSTGAITGTGTLVRTAVDAGAHKIKFWDDDINAVSYLAIGTNLSVSGTGTQAKTLIAVAGTASSVPEPLFMAVLSNETSALTTGLAKKTMRSPGACVVSSVRASLTNAGTGSQTIFNMRASGTTILGTKVHIDSGSKTSFTSTSSHTIADANIANDEEIAFDIDQVGGTSASGAKMYVIGNWT